MLNFKSVKVKNLEIYLEWCLFGSLPLLHSWWPIPGWMAKPRPPHIHQHQGRITNKQTNKQYDKTENCINYLIMGNINMRTFHNILLKLTKVSAFTLSRSIFFRFTLWTVGAGRNGRRRGKCGNQMARRIFLGWGEGENGLGEGGFVGDGGCGAGVGAGWEGAGREGGGDLEPK